MKSRSIVTRSPLLASLCLTLPLLAALAPSRASAAEEKVYRGAMCMPRDFHSMGRTSIESGHIKSTDSFNVDVMCPIVKSVPTTSKIEQVLLNFDMGPTEKTVQCNFHMYGTIYWGGNIAHEPTVPAVPLTIKGTGIVQASLSNWASTVIGAPWPYDTVPTGGPIPEWRYSQFQCDLPAGVKLRQYYVREAGTRDEERKIYPNSMCRPVDSESNGDWYHEPNFVEVGDNGVSPGTVKMVCPVISDRMNNSDGTRTIAEMQVVPPTMGVATSSVCSLFSASNYSTILDSFGLVVTPQPSNPASIRLDLDVDDSDTWGRYFFRCDMSAVGDARILSYRLREDPLASTADPANADGKVYPGALCSGQPLNVSSLTHTANGELKNTSSSASRTTHCPIMTDSYTSKAGAIARFYVRESNATTTRTSCTMRSFSWAGTEYNNVTDTADEPTAGNTGRNQVLDFTLPAVAASPMLYTLSCSLSAGSTLYEYEIQEK
jgi:hypothetical protein